ncbi:hypothetical protein FHR22_000801 [Sphingopyxis panaciterrae]|uniref:hypothetical protein n=1 Tax=Sphingopyxis panaciterrae TaxID=363841 RepID=UPI0014223D70|nr:hypothetical protein [Sphingopyxis panaciterrae]NIJ36152.1 hypothetical protein [Sphingopyxis panaciterrae]
MRKMMFLAAILLQTTAHAAPVRPPLSAVTDQFLLDQLELGEEIEGRADGDLNGDGDTDTVFVVASPDERHLYVVLSYRGEVDIGHQPGGDFKLAPDALGAAELSIAKGVLTVKDLTGGTTALSATYRYRADKVQPKMRLIGLDATVYSRTYAHDGNEMSWNLLTGDVETKTLKLSGEGEDASYDDAFVTRFKRPSKPVYMADTPDPEEQLVAFTKAK